MLGTGSFYLAGGDGTAITFLASGYPGQILGSLPTGRADPEGTKKLIARREGDNIIGPGYESREDGTRWPLVTSQYPDDITGPTAPPVGCPVFVLADEEDLGAPQTPGYELACEVEGNDLILEATHVYSDPGQYQVEAHFLDDSVGVVTGKWQALVQVDQLLRVALGECYSRGVCWSMWWSFTLEFSPKCQTAVLSAFPPQKKNI